MEPRRDEGIVLRKWPVTESSLVVTWFTRQAGKIKTMAKGARRMRGPFVGQLDLFYRDEVLYLPSRRSELHLLTECAVLEPHVKLRESVERLAAAQYVVELVELATEWEDPQPVVFEELAGILGTLEAVREPGPVLVWFEMRLLRWAGWQPRWRADRPEERLLESLGAMNLAGAARVRVAPEQLVAAWRVVWGAWDNSVGREPRTRRLLGKIGN